MVALGCCLLSYPKVQFQLVCSQAVSIPDTCSGGVGPARSPLVLTGELEKNNNSDALTFLSFWNN